MQHVVDLKWLFGFYALDYIELTDVFWATVDRSKTLKKKRPSRGPRLPTGKAGKAAKAAWD